jgi:hypothetical protein
MSSALRRGRLATAFITFLAMFGLLAGATPTTARAADTGTISGTITDSHGPVANALVTAYSSINDGTSVATDAEGNFTFTLSYGAYRILASDSAHHLMRWIGGTDYDTATAYTVSAAPVTAVTTSLVRLATINGTVRLPNGNPAAGAQVIAWTNAGDSGASGTTDASGHISLMVSPGTYLVQAELAGSYPITFYSTAGSVTQRAQGTTFTLEEDATKTTDITFDTGIRFTGTITSAGAKPTGNVSVIGWQQVGSAWKAVGQGTYNSGAGTYDLLLGAGIYIISFNQSSAGRYAERRVVVTAGEANQTLNVDCLPLYDTVATPTITGTAAVGSALTANPGTWSPTPDSFTYQWLRNDAEIAGATASTYTVGTADQGAKLAVIVTAIKAGYFHDYYQSEPTATVPTLPTPSLKTITGHAPKISGTAKVGKTLKFSRGTWSPSGLTFAYRWYRNGIAIKGATKTTYKATKSDKGKYLTVKVTAQRTGYKTLSLTSKKTAKVR